MFIFAPERTYLNNTTMIKSIFGAIRIAAESAVASMRNAIKRVKALAYKSAVKPSGVKSSCSMTGNAKLSNANIHKEVKLEAEHLFSNREQINKLEDIISRAWHSVGGRDNITLRYLDLDTPKAIINAMYADNKFSLSNLSKCTTGNLEGFIYTMTRRFLLDHSHRKRNVHKIDFIEANNCFDFSDTTRENMLAHLIDSSYENDNTDAIIKANMKLVDNVVNQIGLNKNAPFMSILNSIKSGAGDKKSAMPEFVKQWNNSGHKPLTNPEDYSRNYDLVKYRSIKAISMALRTEKKNKSY